MTASRENTIRAKRTSSAKYGPHITLAICSARWPREARASSCEMAMATVEAAIAALIGDSAIISIGFKLPARLQTLDPAIEQTARYTDVVEGPVKAVVRDELGMLQE